MRLRTRVSPVIQRTTSTRPRLLTATIVVAFALAASRWGTNIGISPFFISDGLIALAVAHLAAGRFTKGSEKRRRGPFATTPLFLAFLMYVVVRAVLSIGQAPTIDLLRDAIPFLYGGLALISGYALVRSDATVQQATARVLRWALTFHLVWVTAVSATGLQQGFAILGPIGNAPVFQIRPDIDVALVSIAAALSLRQVLLRRRVFWNLLAVACGLAVVFITTNTRAGQISLVVSLAVAYALTFAASHRSKGRQLFMVMAVPALLAAALLILPTTTAGQRIIVTLFPAASSGAEAELNAQGTQRARELTWQQVIEWTNAEPGRAVFGSGFGNNFLEQSGTLAYLEGTTYENVRSPHNWLVGTYARLGIIGTVLAASWLVSLGFYIYRRRQRIGESDLFAAASLIVVAITPVALLGVVLEAPFGAIPFFWAAGIVMASRRDASGGQLENSAYAALPTSMSRIIR